jgi:light-regulated signal transduction histidine kinase (bacteriophytochrome)
MLAYELRNPLSTVGNAVTVLKMSDDRDDIGFAKDVITRQLKHRSRLIDDPMYASRINRRKIDLRRDVMEVTPIMECAVTTVRPLAVERRHMLDLV